MRTASERPASSGKYSRFQGDPGGQDPNGAPSDPRPLLALSDDPQSTTAWAVGAQGEGLLAKRLDGLADQGVLTLHDPRIPGTRANIDHIAIAAPGVYVIDAKRYKRRPACVWKGVWSGPASSGSSSAVVTAQSWSPASTSR